MAKKQIKQHGQKLTKERKKLSQQKIIIAILSIAVIGFFIVNNIMDKKPEVEYYKFTKEGELTFTDSLGTFKAKINLEIADTEYERQLGLMNRKEMKEDEGMLFIFPDLEYRSFWMLNTFISLDIIFLDENRQIITIHKNTATLSQQSYRSTAPAKYVVEVLAGYTDRHNIRIGDKINWIGSNLGASN